MSLRFTKMHGLGNDFMVIDGINQAFNPDRETIARLASRHTGIGFDQCLLIEAPKSQDHDFFYRIFNGNGEEVGQCGNGARCLGLYVKQYGLTSSDTIRIATKSTFMELNIHSNDSISVDMGKPELRPAYIPLLVDTQMDSYTLPLQDKNCIIHAIQIGNPHAVTIVNDIEKVSVDSLGEAISTHPLFPEQVNAGFMEIVDKNHIRLRVFERGCRETLACGSGAVAAVAVGRLFHNLDSTVEVTLPGGKLKVDWPSFEGSLTLTGPAVIVYEGSIQLNI